MLCPQSHPSVVPCHRLSSHNGCLRTKHHALVLIRKATKFSSFPNEDVIETKRSQKHPHDMALSKGLAASSSGLSVFMHMAGRIDTVTFKKICREYFLGVFPLPEMKGN